MKHILLILLTIFPLFADDATYQSEFDGATSFPISNDQIQMLHEKVVCTGGTFKWYVEMTATYKNFGPETTVQFGFPSNKNLPQNFDQSKSDDSDHYFKTSINGKSVPVTLKRTKEHPELKNIDFPSAYTFDVHFDKNEEKIISHEYTTYGSSRSMGGMDFTYILVTGALWKNKINRIEIEMKVPSNTGFDIISPPEHSCRFDEKLNRIILKWIYTDIEPDFNIYVETLGLYDSNYSPNKNIQSSASFINKYGKAGIRYLKNLIYAYYGYPFQNPLIRNAFYFQELYSENENYSEKYISSYHQEFLKYLTFVDSIAGEYSEEMLITWQKEFPLLSSLNYPEVNPDSNIYLRTLEWPELDFTLDNSIQLSHLYKRYGKLGLQYLRNLVYAHYGYPFKDPVNREAFYYSGRYSENDHYSDKMMSAYHKEFLQKIIKMEKDYK